MNSSKVRSRVACLLNTILSSKELNSKSKNLFDPFIFNLSLLLISPVTTLEKSGFLGEQALGISFQSHGIHYNLTRHALLWRRYLGKRADFIFPNIEIEFKNWSNTYRITDSHVKNKILPRFKKEPGFKVLIITSTNFAPSALSLLNQNGISVIAFPHGKITLENVHERIQQIVNNPEIKKLCELIQPIGGCSHFNDSNLRDSDCSEFFQEQEKKREHQISSAISQNRVHSLENYAAGFR